MTDVTEALHGGCSCGAIRFVIASIFDVLHCHCSGCRKRSGAPVSLSIIVPEADFRFTAGNPAHFRSATGGMSHFCATCGGQLFFRRKDWPSVSVVHGCLDMPEHVLPRAHQWTSQALPWFKIADDLPRYASGEVPHPDKR